MKKKKYKLSPERARRLLNPTEEEKKRAAAAFEEEKKMCDGIMWEPHVEDSDWYGIGK